MSPTIHNAVSLACVTLKSRSKEIPARCTLAGGKTDATFEFIRANIDQIVSEWEEFAKTLSAGTALPQGFFGITPPPSSNASPTISRRPKLPSRKKRKAKASSRAARSNVPLQSTQPEDRTGSTWCR